MLIRMHINWLLLESDRMCVKLTEFIKIPSLFFNFIYSEQILSLFDYNYEENANEPIKTISKCLRFQFTIFTCEFIYFFAFQ